MKPKTSKTIMWVCIAILTIQFLAAGLGKFTGSWTIKFANWGYPIALMYLVAFCEVFGVLGLYFSFTRKWTAILLMLVMLGAAYTVISHAEPSRIVHHLILTGLLITVIKLDH